MKILCSHRQPTKNAKNMLCLWEEDYYNIKPNAKPSMAWSLGSSKLPIIFWCKSSDWKVAVIEDGKTVKEGRVKDILGTTSKYIRLETDGTDVYPWVPKCMKGTQYSHY